MAESQPLLTIADVTCGFLLDGTLGLDLGPNPPPYNGKAKFRKVFVCIFLWTLASLPPCPGPGLTPQNPFHHLAFPLFNIIYCPRTILVERPSAPSGLVEYFFVF